MSLTSSSNCSTGPAADISHRSISSRQGAVASSASLDCGLKPVRPDAGLIHFKKILLVESHDRAAPQDLALSRTISASVMRWLSDDKGVHATHPHEFVTADATEHVVGSDLVLRAVGQLREAEIVGGVT